MEVTVEAPGWESSCVALLRMVLLEVLRRCPLARSATGAKQLWPNLGRLQPALAMLEERLDDPDLSVSELAAKLHVTDQWLRKLFHRALGESPITVLRRRRVECARQLLARSDLPIKDVAARCGMPDLVYFHRSFKKMAGMTPLAWRQTRGRGMSEL